MLLLQKGLYSMILIAEVTDQIGLFNTGRDKVSLSQCS